MNPVQVFVGSQSSIIKSQFCINFRVFGQQKLKAVALSLLLVRHRLKPFYSFLMTNMNAYLLNIGLHNLLEPPFIRHCYGEEWIHSLFLRFSPGFWFIQVLIIVRTSPWHSDRYRWACVAAGHLLGLSFWFLSIWKLKAFMVMFKSNSHQMRMDVVIESLQSKASLVFWYGHSHLQNQPNHPTIQKITP